MTSDKTSRQNRVREALGRLYDQQPPYFREYLRRFREDPSSRVFAPLAEAYRRLGRVDDAIDICREGLQHHPDFHSGRVALAKCLMEKTRYGEAKVELERVVKAVPENLLAQRLLGNVLEISGDQVTALHCYKMALLLAPSDVALSEKVRSLERAIFAGGRVETVVPQYSSFFPETTEEPSHEAPLPTGGSEVPENLWGVSQPAVQQTMTEEAGLCEKQAEFVESEPDESVESDEVSEFNTEDKTASFELSFSDDSASDSLDDIDEVKVSDRLPPETGGDVESVDELLGVDNELADEPFAVEHISAVFGSEAPGKGREITTETLGDLYYSQKQYDRALRIFEKLQEKLPSPELGKKVYACRLRLGVDRQALVRRRKIEMLRRVLGRFGSNPAP